MHLFSKEHLAASSGIVGAEGPTAAGFALSAQYSNSGAIAVAFFGEGAMNQGMLMESLNLAAVWNLPVLFVCKNDGWAITTQSDRMTGGELKERARGLGIPAIDVDGGNIFEVWEASHAAIERARSGHGPTFLNARCVHFEGHFLGFQLIRMVRDPLREMPGVVVPLTKSFLHPRGGALRERLAGLKLVLGSVLSTMRDPRRDIANDPVRRARITLQSDAARLQELENQVEKEISKILSTALEEVLS
jgi:pyruvate dehydrogenase E1 component alpha subunit